MAPKKVVQAKAPQAKGTYNVFISWSGERSRAVATALHSWLPLVIQACAPWMSAKDIPAGKRWRREVTDQLALEIGVVCITRENLDAPWLNFEAGALSRSVPDDTRVIPYCFGLGPAEYDDPLGDFNGVRADRDGTLELVRSLNSVMERPIRDHDVDRVFNRMWDDLKTQLDKIPPNEKPKGPGVPVVAPRSDPSATPVDGQLRPDRMLLEELVERVRRIEAAPNPLNYVTEDGTIVQGLVPAGFFENRGQPKRTLVEILNAGRPPRMVTTADLASSHSVDVLRADAEDTPPRKNPFKKPPT